MRLIARIFPVFRTPDSQTHHTLFEANRRFHGGEPSNTGCMPRDVVVKKTDMINCSFCFASTQKQRQTTRWWKKWEGAKAVSYKACVTCFGKSIWHVLTQSTSTSIFWTHRQETGIQSTRWAKKTEGFERVSAKKETDVVFVGKWLRDILIWSTSSSVFLTFRCANKSPIVWKKKKLRSWWATKDMLCVSGNGCKINWHDRCSHSMMTPSHCSLSFFVQNNVSEAVI